MHYWKINWNEVKTLADLKLILACCEIEFYNSASSEIPDIAKPIKHLLIKKEYTPVTGNFQ